MKEQGVRLSRDLFESIVDKCLALIAKRLKSSLSPDLFKPIPQPPIRPYDGHWVRVFDWFGCTIEERREQLPEQSDFSDIGLTQTDLDLLTLDIAFIFLDAGIRDVHWNESLNTIRGAVSDIIRSANIRVPHYILGTQRWGCYKKWEKIAAKDDVSTEKIRESRSWWKDKYPEDYEA